MTFTRLLFLVIVTLIVGCANRPPMVQEVQGAKEDYRLGVGDVISIRVFGGEEDLRFERVRLNDRGRITLPFGDVLAVGRTTQEVEAEITETVKGKYLRNPRVWVNIEDYRPFFVQGQVARPGSYPFQPGLNAMRAITIAGGFRERAAKDRIFIVRDQDKASAPRRVSPNAPLQPGDTVIVEESFF